MGESLAESGGGGEGSKGLDSLQTEGGAVSKSYCGVTKLLPQSLEPGT